MHKKYLKSTLSPATGRWIPTRPPSFSFMVRAGHIFVERQVDALSPKVNTIAIDLPGHGASDGKGLEASLIMPRLVPILSMPPALSDPILCGLSLGGAIVQQLLIDHPERFAAGILVGTGARLKVMPAIFEAIENNDGSFIHMLNQYAFSPGKPKPR